MWFRYVLGEEDVVDVVFAVVFLRCRLICHPNCVDNKLFRRQQWIVLV